MLPCKKAATVGRSTCFHSKSMLRYATQAPAIQTQPQVMPASFPFWGPGFREIRRYAAIRPGKERQAPPKPSRQSVRLTCPSGTAITVSDHSRVHGMARFAGIARTSIAAQNCQQPAVFACSHPTARHAHFFFLRSGWFRGFTLMGCPTQNPSKPSPAHRDRAAGLSQLGSTHFFLHRRPGRDTVRRGNMFRPSGRCGICPAKPSCDDRCSTPVSAYCTIIFVDSCAPSLRSCARSITARQLPAPSRRRHWLL